MILSKPSVVPLLLLWLAGRWLTPVWAVQVGEEICVEGFIMDGFCLYENGGFLLDRSTVRALGDPGLHTFHCLLDVGICLNSDFHILAEPVNGGGADYTVAYRVDDAGKEMLVQEGRALGRAGSYPACSECTGGPNNPIEGFRAEVRGVVASLGDGSNENPPTLTVSSVAASNGRVQDTCPENNAPPETETPTQSPSLPNPTAAPSTRQPSWSPSRAPTLAPSTEQPTTFTARPTSSTSAPSTPKPSTGTPTTFIPSTGTPSLVPTTQAPLSTGSIRDDVPDPTTLESVTSSAGGRSAATFSMWLAGPSMLSLLALQLIW